MIGVVVSISALAIAGREALREITAAQLITFRHAIALPLIVGYIVLAGPGLAAMRTRRLGMHAACNAVHAAAQFFWLVGISLVPLAQVFALEFAYPLWVVVLAPLLIGEPWSRRRLAAAVVGFAGILIVLRPGSVPLSYGIVAAFLCGIGYGLSTLATKSLTRTDSALQVLFYMTIMQCLMALPWALKTMTLPSNATIGWLVFTALIGIVARISLTRAVALADASLVIPIDFLRLPLIAIAGVLLYQEPLDPWVLAGGALILAANLANVWGARRGPV